MGKAKDMKRWFKVALVALCAVCAFALAGCQQEKPEEPSDTEAMKETTADKTVGAETEPFYVLVVGNDSRTGTVEIDKGEYSDGTGRADTIMLARIDPTTYQVALVTVPRDTAVDLDGSTNKLNEVYRVKGIEGLEKEVESLTGVKIKYYFDTGFVEFENFVNALGGITANVPIDMHLQDIVSGENIELAAGSQDLNGAESLVLARVRKLYAYDLDACRQIQDRQIVEVAINKVASDPANAAAALAALSSHSKTNWPADGLTATVMNFIDHASEITFVSGTGPYSGDFDDNAGGLWLIPRDEATWSEVMRVVEEGGDPTTVVPLPTIVPVG
ncbi:LCP family protein [Raoultibacter phocaeensis]|uniref:LCP family protein n=1 Tax=Raoultibacter phocaeensis TaxID=2479841 RepID=UPI00111A9DC5|nr:LCP family protein [Raoultibacter phocaeensis]